MSCFHCLTDFVLIVMHSAGKTVYSFEIAANRVEQVKQACDDIDYPLLEEYDFRKDK